MSFVGGLKQRKIFQWVLAYLASAWLLTQLVDVVGGRWGMPENLSRIIDVILIIGFLLTIVIAWYHGEKGRQWVSGPELLIIAGLFGIGGIGLGMLNKGGQTTLPEPKGELTVPGFGGRPAIAVLPFQNLSGDPEQEYFADGIAEDLITRLSLWRSFPVIARNSSFVYKGQAVDVKRVGDELGVHYVVEGSVRRAGDKVRLTAQLIDSTTGHHVWAHTYDRDLADVFAVQDEISTKIAASLLGEVERAEGEQVAREDPESLEAWDLYQRAVWHYHRQTDEDNQKAIWFLQQALELDPYFAGAYSRLASVHYWDIALGWTDSPERSLDEVLRNARRSVDLDPRDPIGHMYLGAGFSLVGDGGRAHSAAQRAVELNPSSTEAIAFLVWVMAGIGQANEAIPIGQQGLRLSPHGPSAWLNVDVLTFSYIAAGRYPEAIEMALRLTDMRPEYLWSYLYLAASFANLDRLDVARGALEEAFRLQPELSMDLIRTALAFGDPAVVERYIEALRKAGLEA